jgi:hypothetical protein
MGFLCERTLYRELISGIQDINFNFKSMEVINSEDFLEDNYRNIDLEMLDYCSYFGCKIEREDNRLEGVRW